MAVSGSGQQAAAGQQPAVVLGGGTRRKFAGERQNALPCTKLDGNKTKPKLRKRETHLGLGKKENSMTRGDRPVGGGSGFLPWATTRRERVGSSGEWCGLKRCSGAAFIGWRGEEEEAPEAVGDGTPAATIRAGGASVGSRYRRERKGKVLGGVGWVHGALEEKGRRRGEGGEAPGKWWPARPREDGAARGRGSA
jgi:hypothetical protein